MAVDFEPFVAVSKFWGNMMPMMAMEEMAELIKAISKLERDMDGVEFERDPFDEEPEKTLKQDIIAEMADVSISCAALCDRYKITPAEIGEAIFKKLDKKY